MADKSVECSYELCPGIELECEGTYREGRQGTRAQPFDRFPEPDEPDTIIEFHCYLDGEEVDVEGIFAGSGLNKDGRMIYISHAELVEERLLEDGRGG